MCKCHSLLWQNRRMMLWEAGCYGYKISSFYYVAWLPLIRSQWWAKMHFNMHSVWRSIELTQWSLQSLCPINTTSSVSTVRFKSHLPYSQAPPDWVSPHPLSPLIATADPEVGLERQGGSLMTVHQLLQPGAAGRQSLEIPPCCQKDTL